MFASQPCLKAFILFSILPFRPRSFLLRKDLWLVSWSFSFIFFAFKKEAPYSVYWLPEFFISSGLLRRIVAINLDTIPKHADVDFINKVAVNYSGVVNWICYLEIPQVAEMVPWDGCKSNVFSTTGYNYYYKFLFNKKYSTCYVCYR